MTTTYPMPPLDPHVPPTPALYAVWLQAIPIVSWVNTWRLDNEIRALGSPSPFPLELTTGHDLLCTARYDAEGICHELEGCSFADDDVPPAPRCSCPYRVLRGPAPGVPNHPLGVQYRAFVVNQHCWHHGDRWL